MNTYTEQHAISYHSEVPAWLGEFCAVPEMQRLRGVGMNCGCEYTSFPRFRGLPSGTASASASSHGILPARSSRRSRRCFTIYPRRPSRTQSIFCTATTCGRSTPKAAPPR